MRNLEKKYNKMYLIQMENINQDSRNKNMLMGLSMQERWLETRGKEREFIFIKRKKFMQDSGKKIIFMDLEHTYLQMVKNMREQSKMEKNKVKAHIIIQMEIFIKDNGEMIKKMVQENL